MPRTMTIEKTVFKLEELSQQAQEKAHGDWAQHALDHDWWEFVYEDAATVGELMGIDLRTRNVKTLQGARYAPNIWFSGFWSQGDGACFEGTYSYRRGSVKAVKEHAPQDEVLHRLAQDLAKVQKPFFYKLEAEVKHRGHYYHSGCTSITVEHAEDTYRDIANAEEDIQQILREFMDWIYRQLEKEYEYQTSFDMFKELCEANEWEFDEDGRVA